MLFDAHYHAFTAFGWIPERGIYDNMKTAVDKVGRGKYRKVNKRFYAMLSHYLYEAEFCNPAAGWRRVQVEKAVQDARHGLWYDTSPFKTLNELNQCSWSDARRYGRNPPIPNSRLARWHNAWKMSGHS